MKAPSVNALSGPLVESLVDNAEDLRLKVERLGNGTRIVDAGIEVQGGLRAGCRVAEICLGGLGKVRLRATSNFEHWSWHVDVYTMNPVISCLACQYAGWNLSHGEGEDAFVALGSGPGRAIGSHEDLFDELNYRESGERTALVLEVDKTPPQALCDQIARQCGIPSNSLTLILTPTSSLAGCVQIVARVLETALHKAHTLGFPLDAIVDGAGSAPLCPPSPNYLTAMSRTNDSILFGGQIQLFVDCDDAEAKKLAEQLPSNSSSDYGRPFAEIFKSMNYDFYRIDPMLFSPAYVLVSSLRTGNSFQGGRINRELLSDSFSRDLG